ELLQRAHYGAQHEGERGQLHASSAGTFLQLDARGFQLSNVGLIELRDMGQIYPAGMETCGRYALDAAERLDFPGAELREVGHLHLGQRAAGGGRRASTQQSLDVSLDVAFYDPALATAP